MQKILKILALLCFLGVSVVGCELNNSEEHSSNGNSESGDSKSAPIILTINKWSNGEIVKLKNDKVDEQWFKFVATASIQRIYVKLGTLDWLHMYLYDSNRNSIGSELTLYGNSGKIGYASFSLIVGQPYYVKVTDPNRIGTYRIGFTDFPAQPETVITELNEDEWKNGIIVQPASGGTGEQWFRFVATATSQYFYVKFSTCTDFDVYVYDSDYNLVGNKWNPYAGYGQGAGTIKSNSLSLISDKTYYIKTDNGTGTYWLAFNSTSTAPQ